MDSSRFAGSSGERRRVSPPRPPDVPAARRFPVIATVAPVVGSVVLFAVTRSAFALGFAALGPLVAVASTADSALQRRRARRRERARFARDLTITRGLIEAAHGDERRALSAASPSAHEMLAGLEQNSRAWRHGADDDLIIRLGSGRMQSSLDYGAPDYGTADTGPDPMVEARLSELRGTAGTLTLSPVAVGARAGIGIAGPAFLVQAAARGIVIQLATLLSPEDTRLLGPADADWAWLAELPHEAELAERDGIDFVSLGASRTVRVATAVSAGELPRDVGTVIQLDGAGRARVARAADGSLPAEFDVEYLAQQTAVAGAAQLAGLAERDGVRSRGLSRLPDVVELASLDAAQQSDAATLRAAIGAGDDAPMLIDLVSDGPHAIVGGTTGSGKSELLLSLVLGMAAERAPGAVTFLFVDFKGGAAFDSLARLPHCVGVMTDLDDAHSLRARTSLSAELRYRERALAERGLRSIDNADGPPPFPRLVVMVDEYAALVETHSSLHVVFADIASRGRSLGVHLVLCTQRPAGVIRDSILANCALRLSLRVTSAADSTAVIGTPAAAALPARPLGRALVSVAGAPPMPFQVARSSDADVARIAARWAGSPRPRVPWLPQLPSHIAADQVPLGDPTDDIPFALADLPEQQRQEPARYSPAQHGSLLVVGGSGSGKSGVLAALAAGRSRLARVQVPSDVPHLWDAIEDALGSPTLTNSALAGTVPRVLLIDDVDATVASCQEDYQAPLLELLSRLLRDGPARGLYAVLTAQRIAGGLHNAAALCGSLLTLRMPNRQEHALAGGDAAEFLGAGRGASGGDASPGAGFWRGHRIQVFEAARPNIPLSGLRALEPNLAASSITVVSSRPERFAQVIRELAPGRSVVVLGAARFGDHDLGRDDNALEASAGALPAILVADPDAWQSQWTLFTALRRSSDLLFDGCSLAEFRALTRSRELPPPTPRGDRTLWLLSRDGELRRARLTGPVER